MNLFAFLLTNITIIICIIIFDNFKKYFPFWLLPVQVRLVSVNKSYVESCEKIVANLKNVNIRIDIDDRNESVSKKIKQAKQDMIPYSIVIGEKESDEQNRKEVEAKIISLAKLGDGKPFIPLSWSENVSMQIK